MINRNKSFFGRFDIALESASHQERVEIFKDFFSTMGLGKFTSVNGSLKYQGEECYFYKLESKDLLGQLTSLVRSRPRTYKNFSQKPTHFERLLKPFNDKGKLLDNGINLEWVKTREQDSNVFAYPVVEVTDWQQAAAFFEQVLTVNFYANDVYIDEGIQQVFRSNIFRQIERICGSSLNAIISELQRLSSEERQEIAKHFPEFQGQISAPLEEKVSEVQSAQLAQLLTAEKNLYPGNVVQSGMFNNSKNNMSLELKPDLLSKAFFPRK